MTRLVLTLAGLAACSTSLRGEDLSRDEFERLSSLFSEAHSQFVEKEYLKSNEIYLKLMEQLPKLGAIDPNRAAVNYRLAVNYAALEKAKETYKHLGSAVTHGFWNVSDLEGDTAFESLKKSKEFQGILKKAKNALAGMAFGLKDLDGKVLSKKDYAGKVVIIDIWGTWCRPCRMEIPHFIELAEKYKKQGLRIIGLTYERRPLTDAVRNYVKTFRDTHKMNYPCVLASEYLIQSIPGLSGFPTTFFVDRRGEIRERISGYHNYAELERRVLRLLKEKIPTPPEPKEGEKSSASPGSSALRSIRD